MFLTHIAWPSAIWPAPSRTLVVVTITCLSYTVMFVTFAQMLIYHSFQLRAHDLCKVHALTLLFLLRPTCTLMILGWSDIFIKTTKVACVIIEWPPCFLQWIKCWLVQPTFLAKLQILTKILDEFDSSRRYGQFFWNHDSGPTKILPELWDHVFYCDSNQKK